MSYLLELVDEADKNKDGKIDFAEWEIMGASPRPSCTPHVIRLDAWESLL